MPYKDPETRRAKAREWASANPENRKRWREKNREILRADALAYYYANREKVLARLKQYREANAEKLKEYRIQNRDKIRAREKAYRSANIDRLRAVGRANYHTNPERRLQQERYRKSNPDKVRESARRTTTKRRNRTRLNRVITGPFYSRMKTRARLLGVRCNIPDGLLVIPQRCPVLGIPMDYRDKDHCPSVDRIDNAKGYEMGNVVVISYRANTLKNSATIEEVWALARYMECPPAAYPPSKTPSPYWRARYPRADVRRHSAEKVAS